MARLQAAHVCVIGIGGVGSWAAEALARSGVGAITLIDLDHVAESNINRQIHAGDATLGMAKIEAMARRISGYAPDCKLTLIDDFLSEENVGLILPACDGIIDAIDNVRAKAALIAHCKKNKIALVTTGGAGGRVDPTRVCRSTTCPAPFRTRWPRTCVRVCARNTDSRAIRRRSSASSACSRRSSCGGP